MGASDAPVGAGMRRGSRPAGPERCGASPSAAVWRTSGGARPPPSAPGSPRMSPSPELPARSASRFEALRTASAHARTASRAASAAAGEVLRRSGEARAQVIQALETQGAALGGLAPTSGGARVSDGAAER